MDSSKTEAALCFCARPCLSFRAEASGPAPRLPTAPQRPPLRRARTGAAVPSAGRCCEAASAVPGNAPNLLSNQSEVPACARNARNKAGAGSKWSICRRRHLTSRPRGARCMMRGAPSRTQLPHKCRLRADASGAQRVTAGQLGQRDKIGIVANSCTEHRGTTVLQLRFRMVVNNRITLHVLSPKIQSFSHTNIQYFSQVRQRSVSRLAQLATPSQRSGACGAHSSTCMQAAGQQSTGF